MSKRDAMLRKIKALIDRGYQWLYDLRDFYTPEDLDAERDVLRRALHIVNNALADTGEYCPKCSGELWTKGSPVEYGHTLTLLCNCDSCGHTWIKEYYYFPNTLDSK